MQGNSEGPTTGECEWGCWRWESVDCPTPEPPSPPPGGGVPGGSICISPTTCIPLLAIIGAAILLVLLLGAAYYKCKKAPRQEPLHLQDGTRPFLADQQQPVPQAQYVQQPAGAMPTVTVQPMPTVAAQAQPTVTVVASPN